MSVNTQYPVGVFILSDHGGMSQCDQRQDFQFSILSFHSDSYSIMGLTGESILQQLALISGYWPHWMRSDFITWWQCGQSKLQIKIAKKSVPVGRWICPQTAGRHNLLFLIVKKWQPQSFKLTANQRRNFPAAGNHWKTSHTNPAVED